MDLIKFIGTGLVLGEYTIRHETMQSDSKTLNSACNLALHQNNVRCAWLQFFPGVFDFLV